METVLREPADTQAAFIKFLEKYLDRVRSGEVTIDQVTFENFDRQYVVGDEPRVTTSTLVIRSTNKVS